MSPDVEEKPSFRITRDDQVYLATTILRNPWIPRSIVPTAKQAEFLSFQGLEQFFGGATGGGKTLSLLMAACQYLHVPGYAAVIFRRTFPMLSQSRGIMERATYWWHNSGARWVEDEKRWYFPCKGGGFSSIKFSHMAQENDRYDHLSAEYQFIGFDELTEFMKIQYTFMFGRLRRTMDLVELEVPLRIWSGCVDEGDVLTEHGWKSIQDVTVGEYVYSLSKTGCLQLKRVNDVFSGRSKNLVRIQKKNLYMSMTENHRIVWRKGPDGLNCLEPWNEIDTGTIRIVRTSSSYINKLPSFSVPFGWTTDQYLSFLGLFLAEGSTYKRGLICKTNITQNKTQNHPRITQLLNNLTLSVKGSVRQVPSGNWAVRWTEGGVRKTITFATEEEGNAFVDSIRRPVNWSYGKCGDFTLTRKEIYQHFSQFGRAHEKRVPRDVLECATEEQLKVLLSWMVLGDGHDRGTSIKYFTSSPGLADDVCEIAVKIGMKAQLRKIDSHNENHHDRYIVNLSTDGDTTQVETGRHRSERNDVTYDEYDGNVYCIRVEENENFVIRQKGYVWVSGNSNPGNVGFEWVRDRFIDLVPWDNGKLDAYYEEDADVWVKQPKFVPALLEDNPNVDKKSYLMSMANMDPIERQMYLKGNWRASSGGAQFKREWFAERMLDDAPHDLIIGVRHWDLAATAPLPGHEENKDADWTAGSLLFVTARGDILIYDIQRFQGTPGTVEDRVKLQTVLDYELCFEMGIPVLFSIEQEPGASGKIVVADYINRTLAGYPVIGLPSTGNKFLRSIPLSKQAQAGNVWMMKGFWNNAFFNEMDLYPFGDHDDQIDSCSGAANQLLDSSFIRQAIPAVSQMFAWRS